MSQHIVRYAQHAYTNDDAGETQVETTKDELSSDSSGSGSYGSSSTSGSGY